MNVKFTRDGVTVEQKARFVAETSANPRAGCAERAATFDPLSVRLGFQSGWMVCSPSGFSGVTLR